eukprot:302568-Hanusia_phi.AAC.3
MVSNIDADDGDDNDVSDDDDLQVSQQSHSEAVMRETQLIKENNELKAKNLELIEREDKARREHRVEERSKCVGCDKLQAKMQELRAEHEEEMAQLVSDHDRYDEVVLVLVLVLVDRDDDDGDDDVGDEDDGDEDDGDDDVGDDDVGDDDGYEDGDGDGTMKASGSFE